MKTLLSPGGTRSGNAQIVWLRWAFRSPAERTPDYRREMLDGIADVIALLESLSDRCLEKFPGADHDDPPVRKLVCTRDVIRIWYVIWESAREKVGHLARLRSQEAEPDEHQPR